MLDRIVKTRMQAEGQAIAGGVDLVDQPVEIVALEADDMQHRPEDFALQIGQRFHLDDRRRHEGALAGFSSKLDLFDPVAEPAHALDVLFDDALRLGGDDRADIDGKPVGTADAQLMQRALQHGQRAIRHIFLQAENAQRRAALAGAVEGRRDDIGDDLLGKRRGIDDHGVLAAGFGNQRDRLAIGQNPAGKLALNEPRHFRRARKHHTGCKG
ncbi:hypothetical protein D3C72_1074910 [compost metagenome]